MTESRDIDVCSMLGHVPGCPGRAGGEHEFAPVYVTKRMDAMRCIVCGHRLDEMGGCDSCAADREAAEIEHVDHEESVEGCGFCENRDERRAMSWERSMAGY